MLRRIAALVGVALLVDAGDMAAQTPSADPRPTVAVMPFTGGSMGRAGDYAALGNGIRELMSTALAANPDVRVVERARLQAVLDEQHALPASDMDPATAVRVGRVLGANHIVTGGFLIDTREHVRMDVRSINVETSQVEYRKVTEGEAAELFELIDRLARELNAGLRLPAARSATLPKTGSAGKQSQAVTMLGRAMAAMDRADTTAALAAARDALTAVPDFAPVRQLVAAIEKARTP
jgi:TolB-like protein